MILTSRRSIGALGVSFVAVIFLSGCSDETGGIPVGSQTPAQSAPATSSSPATDGAPTVANPLDPEKFLRRPCDLVSTETLREMGFSKVGEPDIDSPAAKDLHGPTCGWYADDATLSVTVHTVNQRNGNGGLGPVYRSKKSGLFSYVEPISVPGHPDYPAVVGGYRDDRPEGDCPMYVGIRDDLVFVVHTNYDAEPTEGCPAAQKAAASVLDTLKGAS